MVEENIVKIEAEVRQGYGKGISRSLRRSGQIPAIIYGNKRQPVALSLKTKEFMKQYKLGILHTNLIEIDILGNKEYALMRAVDKHVVNDTVQHVDFQFVSKDAEIKIEIPIIFTHESKCIGVKRGGVLNVLTRTIMIKCLPNNIPKSVSIDLSNLTTGHSIHALDINFPKGVGLGTKEENPTIVSISSISSDSESSEESTS